MSLAPRWNKLSDYFFYHHGERVQKIPLDAGASCPNRDGTISSKGCIFCNPQGSGTGFARKGLDISGQWHAWREYFTGKGTHLFMAYLQSFSNTYGPPAQLEHVLGQLAPLPGMIGLAVGTRPDCVDARKLELLASAGPAHWHERWIEFGVQSCHDKTLKAINRGHGSACTEKAIRLAKAANLKVCIHLMAGLPGEDEELFLKSVRWASDQPVDGIKFHCTYVCHGTELAKMYERGEYTPMRQQDYVALIADSLSILRPDIVVHRTTGDPFSGEMVAPEWVLRSRDTNNKLQAELLRRNAWQGKGTLP